MVRADKPGPGLRAPSPAEGSAGDRAWPEQPLAQERPGHGEHDRDHVQGGRPGCGEPWTGTVWGASCATVPEERS